jgi:hypothetical protein
MKVILAKLINRLIKHNRLCIAIEVSDILKELEQENDDVESIINISGLVGDVKPELPTAGLPVEPFFFDPGDPF